ncbi:hypothetical protein X975_21007, partial [Stegodyphus mimosarum]
MQCSQKRNICSMKPIFIQGDLFHTIFIHTLLCKFTVKFYFMIVLTNPILVEFPFLGRTEECL